MNSITAIATGLTPVERIYFAWDDALARNLQIIDATAFALCRDQQLPIRVFNITKPGALLRAVLGEDEGTLVYV